MTLSLRLCFNVARSLNVPSVTLSLSFFFNSIAGQPGRAGSADQKRAGWSSSDGRPDCQGESDSAGALWILLFYIVNMSLIWCDLLLYTLMLSTGWQVPQICV